METTADKPAIDHVDSDSGHTPSDPEKTAGVVSDHHGDPLIDPDAGCSDEERARIDKALVRKLDMKIIPWLCLLYLLAFLDRTNIGNAKLDGLTTDLHLNASGTDYATGLSVFFVSYSLIEPLTNVLLKRMRPSIFIPLIMTLWGLVMTCMGLTHNAAGLIATRFFLGLTEAGLFPGVAYYLSCWYKRSEFGIRIAIFFSAAAVSGSFGGLLAAAINNLAGKDGHGGWAWIFIIEGIITIGLGLISVFMVHDFPDTATFLSEPDRLRVLRRLKLDGQSSAEHESFKMAFVFAALKDWKTYLTALIYAGADCALYAFSLFLPTIINELGFTSTQAQLLSVPPYVGAAILTITVGYLADRTGKRGIFNIGVSLIGIVGFSMLLGGQNAAVRYAGTFLGAMGIYPLIPNTVSWASRNSEGSYKRGVQLGIIIGFGNLNGVVSSNIYPPKDAPHFTPGHSIVIGYMTVLLLGGSILQVFLLKRENRKKAEGIRDGRVQGLTASEIDLLGDRRPDFVYGL